ncbi:MAG: hypothetical protein R3266_15530 [Gemmatimonadota bacterium]|nr:hypothetical protein [Gemmatimonadota bacterium]
MSGRPLEPRIAAGLALASLACMAGIVWAANPVTLGGAGLPAGSALAVAGAVLAFRSFRS